MKKCTLELTPKQREEIKKAFNIDAEEIMILKVCYDIELRGKFARKDGFKEIDRMFLCQMYIKRLKNL